MPQVDKIIKPLQEIEQKLQRHMAEQAKVASDNAARVTALIAENEAIKQESLRALSVSENIRKLYEV